MARCPHTWCNGNLRLLDAFVIFVRTHSQTYIARCNGKTASCTAGAKQAAEALAKKLFGERPFIVKKVNDHSFITTEEPNHAD
jgi:shikimate kinase